MDEAIGGLLLTGGASRRMGRDKAGIRRGGETLAVRAARMLSVVAAPVIEVGPGGSGLPSVVEDEPGSGPLAAMAAGWRALRSRGHHGDALVLAVDLPLVTEEVLRRLAAAPAGRSVVPLVDGEYQSLCARYAAADLDRIEALLAEGHRSMRALLERIEVFDPGPEPWDRTAFADVDTEDDLARLTEWDNPPG